MRLISLGLRNYRNYERLDLEPAPGLNLFLGANGQGKTNLLESIAVLALSSSPRAHSDSELVGPLGPEARVSAVVEVGQRQHEIEIEVHVTAAGARRRIRVNGAARRALELPGLFGAVLFWPDDLALVKSGPENRRRLLNQLLVQVETGYAKTLAGYARVLRQRNHLLKLIVAGEQPVDALDPWDRELVQLGTLLASARARAVAELTPVATASHADLSGGEVLELAYEGPPPNLEEAVHNSRSRDLRRGSTEVGPHRDDITIVLQGRDARSYASQGQQRSVAVTLKLAEADVIQTRSGEVPVLLLDDVLSELDPLRRAALMAGVAGRGQVILTAVEGAPVPAELLASSRIYQVEEGRVITCG